MVQQYACVSERNVENMLFLTGLQQYHSFKSQPIQLQNYLNIYYNMYMRLLYGSMSFLADSVVKSESQVCVILNFCFHSH